MGGFIYIFIEDIEIFKIVNEGQLIIIGSYWYWMSGGIFIKE